MKQIEILKAVHQKGMLSLVAVWATAFFLGSQWGVILATGAACIAYFSDAYLLVEKFKLSFAAALVCFLMTAASILCSILRVM